MGAEYYFYETPFEPDPGAALAKLRVQVFAAGDFNGADLKPQTPEEAVRLTEPDGTRSILDIDRIGDEPDFGTASPFSDEELLEHFGSTTPSVDAIRSNESAANSITRGTARYVVAFKEGKPSSYVFMGYSYD